ncbi:MAG: lysylphosphatidylglycerol synthase domain-containing protein, partial [Rudaea sp.]
MKSTSWNRSLLIASLFTVAVSAVSVWVEWNSAQEVALRFSVTALALILMAAASSYLLRILRFYLLLSVSGVPVSFPGAALAQGVGFALSVTPGSIGDVFKLELIKERAGTTLLRAAPALILDRVLEGSGFL